MISVRISYKGESFQFDTPQSCSDSVGVRVNHHLAVAGATTAEMKVHFSIMGPVVGGTKWLSLTFSQPIEG